MNILEKEIEDLLYEAMINSPELLSERGLYIPHPYKSLFFRQVELGIYGRLDILQVVVTDYKQIYLYIYELKKGEINHHSLTQAYRYGKGIGKFLQLNNINIKHFRVNYRFVLIGKTIEKKGDWIYSLDFCQNVRAYTYAADLQKGLFFEPQLGYEPIEKNFVGSFRPFRKTLLSYLKNILNQPTSL